MELKRCDVEEILENINQLIRSFRHHHIDDKIYTLSLSNGEAINVKIPMSSLPHLLGVNTNYLQAAGFTKEKSAMTILEELIDNSYRLCKEVNAGRLKYEEIFSRYIVEKTKVFLDNIKININETLFVCKYDSSRTYSHTNNNLRCDYIIVRKFEDGTIGVLQLVRREEYGLEYFVPMSNRTYKNLNNIYELIKFQPISILSQLKINDYDGWEEDRQPIRTSIDRKQELLALLRSIAKETNSIVDVSGEFDYRLRQLQKHISIEDTISEIARIYRKGNLVDADAVPDNFYELVKVINDRLTRPLTIGSGKKYSDLISELKKLRFQVLELQEVSNTASEKYEEEHAKLETSETARIEAEEKLQKVYEIVKPS